MFCGWLYANKVICNINMPAKNGSANMLTQSNYKLMFTMLTILVGLCKHVLLYILPDYMISTWKHDHNDMPTCWCGPGYHVEYFLFACWHVLSFSFLAYITCQHVHNDNDNPNKLMISNYRLMFSMLLCRCVLLYMLTKCGYQQAKMINDNTNMLMLSRYNVWPVLVSFFTQQW